MDRDTRRGAQAALDAGEASIVVSVTEARGSVPREAGARMLVSAARCIGTIGGGHLELRAIQSAREMLRTHETAARSEHIALGPALGQCCGGAVALHFELLSDALLLIWLAPQPLFHLQLYGAGHVGRAIAQLLATLDVEVDWIDEREAEFAPTMLHGAPWPAHIRRVCVDAVEAEVRHAPPLAHYLVLTHQHALDLRISEAILQRADFAYFGLIGSRTKRERFVHRFEQRGIAPEVIARMTCPIGIDGIEAKQPEVIAVGVVAQLLQVIGAP